jgi:diguanylate cyclase (GGDEF)-like protein
MLKANMQLSEDEIELAILQRCVEKHKAAEIANLDQSNKCARELDMREVLREIINEQGPALDYNANLWYSRLTLSRPYDTPSPLVPCSDSRLNNNTHRYHARAFFNSGKPSAPAWDRIRELEAKISDRKPFIAPKQLEQKFGILLSPPQEEKDFLAWAEDAKENQYQIAVIFFDIDWFGDLNAKYTETRIDASILPEAQYLIKRTVAARGGAYRHGGDEFLVILPNHDPTEAIAFCEKMRAAFEAYVFKVEEAEERITVSVGIALWPNHGKDFHRVLQAANDAKKNAKNEGRNRVNLAD